MKQHSLSDSKPQRSCLSATQLSDLIACCNTIYNVWRTGFKRLNCSKVSRFLALIRNPSSFVMLVLPVFTKPAMQICYTNVFNLLSLTKATFIKENCYLFVARTLDVGLLCKASQR